MFSDPLLIRFGPCFGSKYEAAAGESGGNGKSPCPVLEFRIVNKLYGDVGGEIMDATLNVVASVGRDGLHSLSPNSNRNSTTPRNESFSSSHGHATSDNTTDDSPTQKAFPSELEDDVTITDKHIFSRMRVEPSDHPFFKRAWLVRHVLDHESPILKSSSPASDPPKWWALVPETQ